MQNTLDDNKARLPILLLIQLILLSTVSELLHDMTSNYLFIVFLRTMCNKVILESNLVLSGYNILFERLHKKMETNMITYHSQIKKIYDC